VQTLDQTCPRFVVRLSSLDDNHAPVTAGAGLVQCLHLLFIVIGAKFGLVLARHDRKQFTGPL